MADTNGRRNKLSLKSKRLNNKLDDIISNKEHNLPSEKQTSDITASEISCSGNKEDVSDVSVSEECKQLEELIQKLILHRKEVFANWQDLPELPSTATQIITKKSSTDVKMPLQPVPVETDNWTPLPPSNYSWRCKQPEIDLQTYYGDSRNYESMTVPDMECENNVLVSVEADCPKVSTPPLSLSSHFDMCEIIPDSPKDTVFFGGTKTNKLTCEQNKQKATLPKASSGSFDSIFSSVNACSVVLSTDCYNKKRGTNVALNEERNIRPKKKPRLDFTDERDLENIFIEPKPSFSHKQLPLASNSKYTDNKCNDEYLAVPSTSAGNTKTQLQMCPLCQMQFPNSLNQIEIDEHIAVCLSTTDEDLF